MLLLIGSFSLNSPRKDQLLRLRRAYRLLAMKKSDEKTQLSDDEEDVNDEFGEGSKTPPEEEPPRENLDEPTIEEDQQRKVSEVCKLESADKQKERTKSQEKESINISPILRQPTPSSKVCREGTRKRTSEVKNTKQLKSDTIAKKSDEEKKKQHSHNDEPVKKSSISNAMAKPLKEEPSLNVNAKIKKADDEKEISKAKARREKETSDRKLSKLKKKIKASELSKRNTKKKKEMEEKEKKKKKIASQRKANKDKKSKIKKKEEKKTFADRFLDQINAVKSLFGGTKAGKAQQSAEAKLSKKNTRLGKVADGDDALPQLGVKEYGGYDDCWIEDPAVMTDRTHRPDLVLVENYSNGGNLWHENKRPFWRNKALQKDVPGVTKTISKILLEVINKRAPIADPAPDPTRYYTDSLTVEEMKIKDEVWFTEDVVLGNTIRSIIGAIYDDSDNLNASHQKPQETKKPAKLVIKDATSIVTYYRHDNTKREMQKFAKSAPGKPQKLKKVTTAPSISSSSSSSYSGSSTTSPTNQNEKGGLKKAVKKEKSLPSNPSNKDKKKPAKK